MTLFNVFFDETRRCARFRAPAGFTLDREQALQDGRCARRKGMSRGEALSMAIAAQIAAYEAQLALSEALASVARIQLRTFTRPSVAPAC